MRLHRINALLLKYYFITRNSLDRMFDVIYWPLLDIFIWGFTIHYIEAVSNVNLLSIIFGGVILWVFVWRSSQDLAVYVLEDYWSKNLYNMFTSPVEGKELVVSLLIFGVIRAIFSFLVLLILATIVYSFDITNIGLMPFVVSIPALIIIGWTLGIIITAIILLFGHRIQVFAWSLVWFLQPFSCVFYPLDSLPNWARYIAAVMPTTPIFENLRNAVYNNAINWNGILYSYTSGIILFILAGIFFEYALNNAKKTGVLTKND